jgi:putative ABC transport system substrate-binding protein
VRASKTLTFPALVIVLLGLSFPAEAQHAAKLPRMGWLAAGSSTPTLNDAFREGMRQLGYIEGQNIVFVYRYSEGNFDRLLTLASELVSLRVEVIFASGGYLPVIAAKKATTTIPIVMSNVDDPVAMGLVSSLARPSGNITGLSGAPGLELHGKRLELLKESLPTLTRVAVLWSPENPGSAVNKKEYEVAASRFGMKIQSVEVREPTDLEQAFSTIKKVKAEALVTVNSPLVSGQRARIVEFAASSRLPTISAESRWTDAGALMSYGPSYPELYRRAATYVDKILKGSHPTELPVEQPAKFELVINLKAANQIGLTIPPHVLARADRVIK